MNQDCPSVWIFAWGSTDECQRFIDHHVETVFSNDHVSENNFSPKNISPGRVKAKNVQRKRSFLFDLFAVDIIDRHPHMPQHLMARCPESWFAGATSGQAPQFLSDTNDTETTWHSTLSRLLWRKDWKLRLFLPLGHCGSGEPPISSKPTGVPRKRKSTVLTSVRNLTKICGKTHALPPSPRLREGRGCSDTPSPPPQTAEKAPPKRSSGYFQMATGPPGGNISGICSMVNQPNLAKWSMQIAQPKWETRWRAHDSIFAWQLRCPHLCSWSTVLVIPKISRAPVTSASHNCKTRCCNTNTKRLESLPVTKPAWEIDADFTYATSIKSRSWQAASLPIASSHSWWSIYPIAKS